MRKDIFAFGGEQVVINIRPVHPTDLPRVFVPPSITGPHKNLTIIRNILIIDGKPLFAETHLKRFDAEDSPAYELGFEPFDLSDVGPRPKEKRD